MVKSILISISFVFLFCKSYTQVNNYEIAKNELKNRGEVYLKSKVTDKEKINEITKIVSIAKIQQDTLHIFANEKGFEKFLKMQNEYTVVPYQIKQKPKETSVKKKENESLDFGRYPTYNEYIQFMYSMVERFPEICKLYEIGKSKNGKKILFLKISDNATQHEAEPELMYSGGIHGNEPASYIIIMRLAEHLLSNYQNNTSIQNLINNTQIWINPLANPDGMYRINDNTVVGGTRYNANNIDLNRNFPDYVAGNNPDGNAHQDETKAFINFFKKHNFILSANFHTGTEVLNYPYDCIAQLHPDNNYFVNICRKYADTAQAYSQNYMTSFNNGITNGYSWYEVYGGRQDYLNIFCNTKEVTIEIWKDLFTEEEDLNNVWEYNYRSLINYLAEGLYGLNGTITDSLTNKPLKTKFFVKERDNEYLNSFIYSDSTTGYYHKIIENGNYQATISKVNYQTKEINFLANNTNLKTQNIQLKPLNTGYICFNITDSINNKIENYKILLVQDNKTYKEYSIDTNSNNCIQLSEGNYNIIIKTNSNNLNYLDNIKIQKDSTINMALQILNIITTQNSPKQSVNIYPNPFNNYIYVETNPYKPNDKIDIEIKTITGKLILFQTLNNKSQEINLKKLQQGVYILNIYLNNKPLKSKKIIKEDF